LRMWIILPSSLFMVVVMRVWVESPLRIVDQLCVNPRLRNLKLIFNTSRGTPFGKAYKCCIVL
jgi:hypothetical protein